MITRDSDDRMTGFKLRADNNGVQDLVFVRKDSINVNG